MIQKVIEFTKPAGHKQVLQGYLIYNREYADKTIEEDLFDTELLAECNTPFMLGSAQFIDSEEVTPALQSQNLMTYPEITRTVDIQLLPIADNKDLSDKILPHGFYEFNFRCKENDDRLIYLPPIISCRISQELIEGLKSTISPQ